MPDDQIIGTTSPDADAGPPADGGDPAVQPVDADPPDANPPGGGQQGGKGDAAVAAARTKVGRIQAKQAGDTDPDTQRSYRVGYQDLLEIFNLAYGGPGPGRYNEDDVKYVDGQFTHWCGIFATWALKSAGVQVGNWINGSGISGNAGVRQLRPGEPLQAGDIAYKDQPYQHHALVISESGGMVSVVEGNAGTLSEVLESTNPRSTYNAFYRARELG